MSKKILPENIVLTDDTISICVPDVDSHGDLIIKPYLVRRGNTPELSDSFDSLKLLVLSYINEKTIEKWDELRSYFIYDKSVNKNILKSSSNIELHGNDFYYKGYKIKNYLSERILDIFKQSKMLGVKPEKNLNSLALFLDNLMKNPSQNSVNQLYKFVENTRLPITDDGCLLAYKIITHDYKDKYTATMDYRVGKKASMPRSMVMDDKNIACGPGLHFCSWNYARGFFCDPSKDRMVVVKVNPKDVVSVPTDHLYEKGRCCKYKILYEIPMEEVMEKDVLGILK